MAADMDLCPLLFCWITKGSETVKMLDGLCKLWYNLKDA